jgi:hypothetical protein
LLNFFNGSLFLHLAIFKLIDGCVVKLLFILLNLWQYLFLQHRRKPRFTFGGYRWLLFFFYLLIRSGCWWLALNILKITDNA